MFPSSIAAYLVIGPDGPVLVETGPGSTLPNLLNALADEGYAPSDIKHVLLHTFTLIMLEPLVGGRNKARMSMFIPLASPHLIDPSRS